MTEPSGAVEAVARAIKAVWDAQSQLEADNSGGAMEYEPGPWQEWEPEARAAIAAMPTPSDQEKLEKAMGEALILIDEINKRSDSRCFYGISHSTHAKLCTIRATLQIPLARMRPERSPK